MFALNGNFCCLEQTGEQKGGEINLTGFGWSLLVAGSLSGAKMT